MLRDGGSQTAFLLQISFKSTFNNLFSAVMYEATVTVENKSKGLRKFGIPFITQISVFSPPFHFNKNVLLSVFPSILVIVF